MNKSALHQTILATLNEQLQVARHAAQQAHDTATHEENVAENKYDTLGLEAAYLAEGQSKRVLFLESDIQSFTRLPVTSFDEETPIGLGALIKLESTDRNDNGGKNTQWIFLSPVAGGLEISLDEEEVLLVTPESPVGKSLQGAFEGDEVLFGVDGSRQMHEAVEVL